MCVGDVRIKLLICFACSHESTGSIYLLPKSTCVFVFVVVVKYFIGTDCLFYLFAVNVLKRVFNLKQVF